MTTKTYPRPTHDSLIAQIARCISPSYGWCYRCGVPWRFAEGHMTNYRPSEGLFVLCHPCWVMLTVDERLPYYRTAMDLWHNGEELWPAIERAVRAEP